MTDTKIDRMTKILVDLRRLLAKRVVEEPRSNAKRCVS